MQLEDVVKMFEGVQDDEDVTKINKVTIEADAFEEMLTLEGFIREYIKWPSNLGEGPEYCMQRIADNAIIILNPAKQTICWGRIK